MKTPNRIEKILIRRDELTFEEARLSFKEAKSQINEVIENGGSLEEVEYIVMSELGLECDFVEDFIY